MKTACVALLVFASMASCEFEGKSARLTFHPAEKVANNSAEVNMHDAQNPAVHVFPKAPTVPFRPLCPSEGYFRDPYNCGKFYNCNGPDAVPKALYCSPGLVFDMETSWCDHPDRVEC